MNILIKLASIVALIIAPLIAAPEQDYNTVNPDAKPELLYEEEPVIIESDDFDFDDED